MLVPKAHVLNFIFPWTFWSLLICALFLCKHFSLEVLESGEHFILRLYGNDEMNLAIWGGTKASCGVQRADELVVWLTHTCFSPHLSVPPVSRLCCFQKPACPVEGVGLKEAEWRDGGRGQEPGKKTGVHKLDGVSLPLANIRTQLAWALFSSL